VTLRAWLSGGLGSVRWTVGLGDLQGLFQPKSFYDSIAFGNCVPNRNYSHMKMGIYFNNVRGTKSQSRTLILSLLT